MAKDPEPSDRQVDELSSDPAMVDERWPYVSPSYSPRTLLMHELEAHQYRYLVGYARGSKDPLVSGAALAAQAVVKGAAKCPDDRLADYVRFATNQRYRILMHREGYSWNDDEFRWEKTHHSLNEMM